MSSSPDDEEPVAYLGGKAGEDDAPVGFLGGAAGQEEVPSLPPAGVSAVYSASDFIAPPPEVEEPPSYDNYAAEPVAEAAPAASDMEQYAHPAEEEPPPENPATQTVVEPSHEGSSEFDEPGLPKTISQQDAENIIKRITTKKILPPEVAQNEGPRVNPPAELTPRGSPKLGRLVFVIIILLGGYGAAVAFNDQVAPYLPPELWWLINYTPPKVEEHKEHIKELTPAEKKEKALRKIVLESEWRAFGYNSQQDYEAANRDMKAAATQKPVDATNGGTKGATTPGGDVK